jgi:thioredoxin reductase
MHGFLTRDGTDPAELRRIGREQLVPYDTVEVCRATVVDAVRDGDLFVVTRDDGALLRARKLLLATGVVDNLPDIPGIDQLYCRSVFLCPYCDGWELRDQPLAVYGHSRHGYQLALELTAWSRDLVLCTNGPADLRAKERERLARNNIAIREERITRLEHTDGMLERVIFETGAPLPRRAMFFITGYRQRSDLPARLGVAFTSKGAVRTTEYETTDVPGLYVAGDASRKVQLVIIAAAEGAEAAFAINSALLRDDLT